MVAPGTIVDEKYVLLHPIGSGGQGQLFEAEHIVLRSRVAIKTLHEAGSDAIQRFLREARIAASFKGDHVAKIFDVGSLEDGTPFIVMELLKGRSLDEERQARSVSPSEIFGWLSQVSLALGEMHAAGAVHRDVKPSNIFIRSSSKACLIDFGIARASTEAPLTRTGNVFGSPRYMAPEQIASTKDVGPPADVYSLCVVLYEALSGRVPFEAPNVWRLLVLQQTRIADPLDVAGVPDHLRKVVARGLSFDSSVRPSIQELRESLLRCFDIVPSIRPRASGRRLFGWTLLGTLVAGACLLAVLAGMASDLIVERPSPRLEPISARPRPSEAEQKTMSEAPISGVSVPTGPELVLTVLTCIEKTDEQTSRSAPEQVCDAMLRSARAGMVACLGQMEPNCIVRASLRANESGTLETIVIPKHCAVDASCLQRSVRQPIAPPPVPVSLNLNLWRHDR